jgi:hypothetical protein
MRRQILMHQRPGGTPEGGVCCLDGRLPRHGNVWEPQCSSGREFASQLVSGRAPALSSTKDLFGHHTTLGSAPAHLLLTNGEWLELSDYFWSARTYHEVLAEVGFTDLQVEAPVLADAYGLADPADLNAYDYDVERTRAPMMLIHGCRPGA